MIDDLRHFRATDDDPFVIFTEGEAAVLLACVFALGFIISTLGA